MIVSPAKEIKTKFNLEYPFIAAFAGTEVRPYNSNTFWLIPQIILPILDNINYELLKHFPNFTYSRRNRYHNTFYKPGIEITGLKN